MRFKRRLAILALAAAGGLVYVFIDLPSPARLTDNNMPASSRILDRNGEVLYEIYAEKNRTPVKLSELPEYIPWATLAAEDKNFYQHHGFDLKGITRAAYNTIFKKSLQGGSTLTQQLVKNSLLTPERTIKRKIREAFLTAATEISYSKDQILEMYLNQAPYGGTAWGIETAAEMYFGKHARELSLAEAALLAGLPVSPTRFSPFGAHPELAKQRQALVLQQMIEMGKLKPEEKEKILKEDLVYAEPDNRMKAPHFVLYVKDLLVEKYGEKMVAQGGLTVTTTLDLDLQDWAQTTVASETAKLVKQKISNGAVLVTKPETGEILAMIGSRDYFNQEIDGNVNVVTRPRQPGSAIKPVNYAAALEKKLITPATVLNDVATCFQVAGQKNYCPVNYDGQFHGPVTVRFALANSYNIPAVKVLALNTLEEVVAKGKEMGLTTWKEPVNYGLSLTLGGGEVTMYDLATAYSTFANLGIRQDLWAIKKVEDISGKVIFDQPDQEGKRALPMEVAYLINHILLDNGARSAAFGTSSWLAVKNHPEVSVKTGTTNDLRDNWTIGWTPSTLVVAWVGNNDNSPMSYVASGVTGASPIWNKIISYALKDKKEQWPSLPEGLVGAEICATSGFSPNPAAPCQTRFEYFLTDTLPPMENLKQGVEIDKTTGALANEQTLPENKEIQEKNIITDPLSTKFCLDCPFPAQAEIIKIENIIHPAPVL
ncbi:MAG: transglycosylase domain-containing protein [Candidatus Shapirobacteria bacterium]